ncbi:MAG TPA: hypothetical protein VGN72_01050 [Tepidisphaeraceae bacterium]|nr:hypothetical protein [Tepidisphaeraceae bacterium]
MSSLLLSVETGGSHQWPVPRNAEPWFRLVMLLADQGRGCD